MASSSKTPAPGMQQLEELQIKLSLLEQLKEASDKEVNMLRESLETLQMAQGKFAKSGKAVESITPDMKGNTILVPLTSSMYVPGTILDSEHVIIDIGTGYYAEKDIEGAKDYFKRKVDYVAGEIKRIQTTMINKADVRNGIAHTLQLLQAEVQGLMPTTS